MSKTLAAVVLCLAFALAIAGIVISRRAVKLHGSEALRGGGAWFNPARWVAVWNMPYHFADPRGLRLYLIGAVLLFDGMTVVIAILAYASGRGW
jgi:hypothetical protein